MWYLGERVLSRRKSSYQVFKEGNMAHILRNHKETGVVGTEGAKRRVMRDMTKEYRRV